ncbi:Alanine--tRNA ligase, cytoplasmic [Toxocara canis]|uniref:Alanine--tRNA ligase n=1 Tax=Toxocara canis TaxID=6265 RepID=A0A0B2VFV1_TOXCA|nr:Alanine--tRNA ligase, cytoplasmic [Toxocara canis]
MRHCFGTMSSSDIRQSFLNFFMERGHTHVPSSPIVNFEDPSLLFVTAGMNQFKSVILGTCKLDDPRSSLRRVVNSQKCLRAGGKHNDLDDVGRDLAHHTFFEMLGNWSFGDYFKEEACSFAWQYLTEVLRLPSDRLYVSYFGGDHGLRLEEDDECRGIWKKLSVHPSRILRFGVSDNFWEMAETGPCGPCSEIHFDMIGGRDASQLVNTHDPSVVEIWNLVFMQYSRNASGHIVPLPRRHIDCGMGLERTTAIMQQVHSSYDTDLFAPLISEIAKYAKSRRYGGLVGRADTGGSDTAYRTVADHLRALCIAISDGVLPDAAGRGYVLRRMLRRAARMSSVALQADRGLLTALVPFFTSFLAHSFPELTNNAKLIEQVISSEESQFWRVVDRGEKLFAEEANKSLQNGVPFSGEVAWYLHNTHGFPVELISMLAEERDLAVDLEKFEDCRRQAKVKNRVKEDERCWRNAETTKMREVQMDLTKDMYKYEYMRAADGEYVFAERPAKIMGVFSEEGTSIEELGPNVKGCVVLDETIYFAEQGGQIADNGVLYDLEGDEVFAVNDVQRKDDFVFLIGHTMCKKVAVEMNVSQKIDAERRLSIMRAHTGTHLLLHALRILFGSSVYQKGSLVSPDRIRFDCTLQRALSEPEAQELERIVNEFIESGQSVFTESVDPARLSSIANLQSAITASLMEATSSGLVRVVSVGEAMDGKPAKAVECCCGTHVANTRDLGAFVLLLDKSLSSGVRRIMALTGDAARLAVDKAIELKSHLEGLDWDAGINEEVMRIEKEMRCSELPLLLRKHLFTSLKQMKKTSLRMRKRQAAKGDT